MVKRMISKSGWSSKTLWVNGLLLVAGVAGAVAVDVESGLALSFIGLVNIVLRVMTSLPLK